MTIEKNNEENNINISGVVNATKFKGDASGLTNLEVEAIGSNKTRIAVDDTSDTVDSVRFSVAYDNKNSLIMDNNSRIGIGNNYPKHKFRYNSDTNITGNLRLNDSIAYPEAFQWTSVGPNRILSENVENITDINGNSSNFISGPIECSVFHPTNNNIMFVGTVNGNIWKTENAQSPI